MSDERRQALQAMGERLQGHMTAAYIGAKERADDADMLAAQTRALADTMREWADAMRDVIEQTRDLAAVLRDDGEPK